VDFTIKDKSLPELVGVESQINFLLCELDAIVASKTPPLPI
jgi:hypothetical protein